MPIRTGSLGEPLGGVTRGGAAFSAASLGYPLGGPLRFSGFATPSTIANTNSETLFTQWTMPANTVNVLGAMIRIRAGFIYSTTGTPTLAIKCYLGGLSGLKIMDRGVGATDNNASNVAVVYDVPIAWDSGAANAAVVRFPGSIATYASKTATTTAILTAPQVTGAIGNTDFTAALTIGFSVLWGAASASNTITQEAMTVEVMYPAVAG